MVSRGRGDAAPCHYGAVASTSASAGALPPARAHRPRAEPGGSGGAHRGLPQHRERAGGPAHRRQPPRGGRPGREHRRAAPDAAAVQQPRRVRARRRPRAPAASTSRSPTCRREILATVGHPIDIADGPRAVLAEVDRLAQKVLAEAGLTPADVCAVGVGVPGPVEFSTGRPSYPPIMPGWHDYPVPSAFGRLRVPGLRRQRRQRHGPGRDRRRRVGAGRARRQGRHRHRLRRHRRRPRLPGGAGQRRRHRAHLRRPARRPHRASAAAARRTASRPSPAAARCSATPSRPGCRSRPSGTSSSSPRRATAPALELVRDAGRTIGTVLAALVNFFNPHRIVMTGGVAQAGVPLLAGIREAVYRPSMPLAARALEITVSDAPDLSGRVGAARWRSRSSSTRTPSPCEVARPADRELSRRVGPGGVRAGADVAAPHDRGTATGRGAVRRTACRVSVR